MCALRCCVFCALYIFTGLESSYVCALQTVPVVMWHGMGDFCCNPLSLGYVKKLIEKEIPGIYVKSLKIGSTVAEDIEHGYFMNVNKQVEDVCKQLQADPNLSGGYNAIGFSQGGQFLRAVAQRCPVPRVKNLISVGGQHQGVFGVPNCSTLKHKWCSYISKILTYAAYENWVQNEFVQAQYWHDSLKEEQYRSASVFLADINNERSNNTTYKENLLLVENFVMIKFNNDTVVEPKETEWFGFYKPGQISEFFTLQESDLYKKDLLGLRQLDETGRLKFLSVDGNHLQFTEEWFIDNIVKNYLLNKLVP
ncbi:palmitoyl-protein thioesterase 1 [Bacillus rossius redtenbacheri]|uniref:palmitoyl-protein thioesterase 1 n=1 Tax=Bacillus rossius redtenbacheri TaxID=93214 RepID=UPI002FDF08AC